MKVPRGAATQRNVAVRHRAAPHGAWQYYVLPVDVCCLRWLSSCIRSEQRRVIAAEVASEHSVRDVRKRDSESRLLRLYRLLYKSMLKAVGKGKFRPPKRLNRFLGILTFRTTPPKTTSCKIWFCFDDAGGLCHSFFLIRASREQVAPV